MKKSLKLLTSFILTTNPWLVVTVACDPNKINQNVSNIYNLIFDNPHFKNSHPIEWQKKSSFVQNHHQNTNFFNLLSGHDVYAEENKNSYFYNSKIEVYLKLRNIYNSIPNANSEPIFGDALQLAKTTELYANYSASSSYLSNYDRILTSKLSSDINPPSESWWKTDYYYHGQNWRVIFKNLFKVFQKYNSYLDQPSHDYQNYFNIFLKYVSTFGYASTLSDFHFFVKVMEVYKILFGLLSPAAVARIVGKFIMKQEKTNVNGTTLSGEFETDRLETQMIFYNPNFNRLTSQKTTSYELGWLAAYSEAEPLVHEFGHALDYLLTCTPQITTPEQDYSTRKYLDWNPLPPTYAWSLFGERPFDYFVDAVGNDVWQELLPYVRSYGSGLSINKLYEKYASFINTIITYSVVRSNYGRTFTKSGENINNNEIQAEAFAQWLLTPKSQRSQGWQVLDHIFGGSEASSYINEYDGHNPLNE